MKNLLLARAIRFSHRSALALGLALGTLLPQVALAEIKVQDITGREVVLEAPAQRIVLGEGRHLTVLGMLHDNPVERVVGWRQDKGLDPATLQAYEAAFPSVKDLAPVGAGNRQLSVESVIALAPDLVLLALMDATDPQMKQPLAQLEAAGIPYAFIDFFVSPLSNTLPSLEILGQLTGGEQKAAAFSEFYRSRLQTIQDGLKELSPEQRPSVFVHVHAAADRCCATVGTGVFHDFVTEAGGRNMGQELVPGVMGNVGLESLLTLDPDIYLATGGAHMAGRGGLVMGPDLPQSEADASFAKLLADPSFASWRAVEEGRAYGLWHLFNDTPMHIAAIEFLAKSFHPERFESIDPAATLAEISADYSPIPLEGSWWSTAP